ncbi:Adenylate cyclase, class 3 [Thalassolituus maritimus]|uniref:Adenylate cyclase, class 3 n=1 Tax=Thalassolituus maritimus TaxID=484498 RepID=A0A1N7PFB6_9GAMM|nr:adenylate/guanylate cyclase domain-containing protein [Thalassolituus maritimus]SIT09220.1 Adenylate cyclase, class 3 [Thalassolituus maritimus]
MSSSQAQAQFHETTLPKQDYVARIFGYAVAAVSVYTGIHFGYFPESSDGIAMFALLYPHLVYFASGPFRRRKAYTTRQFLIHGDALLCGIFLGLINFPIEIVVLFAVMINTSFIVVGSLTAWAFCIISLVSGAGAAYLLTGYTQPAPVPYEVFVATAAGVGFHLALTAHNSYRQARDLMRLKMKFQGQVERFQALSHQVSKYVAPQIWESIFSGRRQVRLETQRKKLVVFFSDIVGFSALSEQMEAESFTDLLNTYLTDMSHIALKYGGTIDKFIGDGIMIFFGDPKTKGTKRDALACVSMAIEMRNHMEVLRQRWADQGISAPLQIRMGISTGYCTVGNFGTESRMDYTIIGKEVNLASRLETEATPGEILVSQDTYTLIRDKIDCRSRGNAIVKGFRDPIPTFEVRDYRSQDDSNERQFIQESEGFSLRLDRDQMTEAERLKAAETLEKAARRLRINHNADASDVTTDAVTESSTLRKFPLSSGMD